jgi:[ribosomal protein S18]-alanine N-acetyltransferase
MIDIVEGDAADIASIMPAMEDAFDPAFGESWTAAQCLSALAMPDCRLLIAKSGDIVAGFTMSRWVLDMEELLMIGVSKVWQRQNVGSMLLGAIVDHAREAGRAKLFLEVRDGNPAHDFYSASGFQPIGRRKQYYRGANGFRPDAITMAMNL